MIFLTVGHQTPFDRLVEAVDAWAGRTGRGDVFGQIGAGDYRPRHIEWVRFLPPERFREYVGRSHAVVGHAGTGTIILALELGKPLLVLPRRRETGETRNDHQWATARHFQSAGQILVVEHERELPAALEKLEGFRPRSPLPRQASAELIERLRSFIHAGA